MDANADRPDIKAFVARLMDEEHPPTNEEVWAMIRDMTAAGIAERTFSPPDYTLLKLAQERADAYAQRGKPMVNNG